MSELKDALPLGDPELWRKLQLWYADKRNLVELAGLVLASLGMTFLIGSEGSTADASEELEAAQATGRSLLSYSLAVMWTGVGLRVCEMVPSLSAMVRMMEKILLDVGRWMALLIVVLIGFSAATYSHQQGLVVPAEDDTDCAQLVRDGQASILFTIGHLFRIAIGASSDLQFECSTKEAAYGPDALFVAPTLAMLWLVVSMVLMMNLLSTRHLATAVVRL